MAFKQGLKVGFGIVLRKGVSPPLTIKKKKNLKIAMTNSFKNIHTNLNPLSLLRLNVNFTFFCEF